MILISLFINSYFVFVFFQEFWTTDWSRREIVVWYCILSYHTDFIVHSITRCTKIKKVVQSWYQSTDAYTCKNVNFCHLFCYFKGKKLWIHESKFLMMLTEHAETCCWIHLHFSLSQRFCVSFILHAV